MTHASAGRGARRPKASSRSKEILSQSGPVEENRTAAELARALTALKANSAENVQRKKQLRQLNRQLDIALNNMGRGLSMFDSRRRLIVCNRLYREIYGLPERLTRPDTPLEEIVRYHVKQETGHNDAEKIEQQCNWIESHAAKLASGETFTYTQHLESGRTVLVTNQPLPAGGWVDIQEDVTERRKAEQKITWLAHHDPLTEVANRMYFSEELENALRHIKPGAGFALHWLDLDRFKEINDTLGHPVGDELLKSLAKGLLKSVRKPDLVARLGGDEFAIIQAGAKTRADAEKLTQRLLRAVSEPHHVLGHTITVGASIGVVLAPEDGSSAEELIKNVDLALYSAKDAGRGTYVFFDQGRNYKPEDRCEPAADPTRAAASGLPKHR